MTTDQAQERQEKLFDKLDKKLDTQGKANLREIIALENQLTASEEQPDNYLTEKE